ncbi:MAG: hypothetical protein V1492_03280 [Candidatus Micrarchaeota archaeon]
MRLLAFTVLLLFLGFVNAAIGGDPACLADKPHKCYISCCSEIGGTPVENGDGTATCSGAGGDALNLCIRQKCTQLAVDCATDSPTCGLVHDNCRRNCELGDTPMLPCLTACDDEVEKCLNETSSSGCCSSAFILLALGAFLVRV